MVAKYIKWFVRSLFRRYGIELSRYYPETDKWLAQKKILKDIHSPLIFDVGANIGQTLDAYANIFPHGEIHCFEPYPNSFQTLQQAVNQRKYTHAHPLAISDKIGNSIFHVNTVYHVTNSLLPRPTHGTRYYPKEAQLNEAISVSTDTLDSFTQRAGINKIDILKMDIQGGELAALHGAAQLLESHSIKLIMIEIMFIPHYEGGALFHEVNKHLLSKGYSLFGIYDIHYADNGQLRFADAIYINSDLRNTLK